ncbi:MAG TPA: hypothetical protein VLB07_15000, partial [Woeseiaceae bacterium]|nr:hypothetical protein [Woeseiaceae bacterium]
MSASLCQRSFIVLFVALFSGYATVSAADAGDRLERQRASFVEAFPAAELGDWGPVEERQDLLSDYILWPDLRAAWLKARLKQDPMDAATESEVLGFLSANGSLRLTRDLRYSYALKLASMGRLSDYLSL